MSNKRIVYSNFLSIVYLDSVLYNRHMSNQRATTDRRIQRTRRMLRMALLSLIAERGYESLSIQEIAERADIGRATFYLHYRDKQELLFDCADEVLDELVAQLGMVQATATMAHAKATIQQTFAHVAAHAAFYRALLGEHGVALVPSRVRAIAAEIIRNQLEVMLGPEQPSHMPHALFAQQVAGALMAAIEWWLAHEESYTAEQAAEFHWQFVVGAFGILAM
jgi:AcrR family transcriptional regulator